MTKQKHLIDETARVYCLMRGRDVDLEVCLACRRLVEYDFDSRRPYLVCRSPEDLEGGASRGPSLALRAGLIGRERDSWKPRR